MDTEPKTSKLKTGRYSVEEIQYLVDNQHRPTEELAKELNRTPESIAKYIRLNVGNLSKKDAFGNDEIELDLQKLPFWNDIIDEFDIDEQNKFIFDWNRMIDQFMGDVQFTEQVQIIDVIKLDIMLNRLLKEKRRTVVDIERIQDIVDILMESDQDDRDMDAIIDMERQMAALRASQDAINKQYKDLLAEKNKLYKELKATRDQRLKVLENTKENFPQFLSKLTKDKHIQEKLGVRLAKMKLAKEKERERLAEYHTYEDGTVDRPFLTPEVVLEKAENEIHNQDI